MGKCTIKLMCVVGLMSLGVTCFSHGLTGNNSISTTKANGVATTTITNSSTGATEYTIQTTHGTCAPLVYNCVPPAGATGSACGGASATPACSSTGAVCSCGSYAGATNNTVCTPASYTCTCPNGYKSTSANITSVINQATNGNRDSAEKITGEQCATSGGVCNCGKISRG